MSRQVFVRMVMCVFLLSVFGSLVTAQLPATDSLVPAGFKVVTDQRTAAFVMIDATKPNENVPRPHMDPGISLRISWSMNPMARNTLSMMGNAPEDPVKTVGMTRDEPCGRERYRGGILTCRRVTTPWIGEGSGPDLVTWNISWMGATDTGIIGCGVSRFHGGREGAMGLIDPIIEQMTGQN